MDLAPILARLKSQLTGFKTIGSAADLEALGASVAASPSCYLLPMAESAEDNRLLGAFEQRVSVTFSVVLAVSNKRDAGGSAAMGDLEPLRALVRAALIGWPPDPAIGEPVRFAGGHLLRFENALLWWMDEFRVTTYLRSP